MSSEASFSEFDREYGLADLLPITILEDIGLQVLPMTFAFLYPDGSPYYPRWPFSSELLAVICASLDSISIGSSKSLASRSEKSPASRSERITLFPITHEMEISGYFAVSETEEMNGRSIGILLQKVLTHLMRLRYGGLLTSRLHGQVVEESYQELQQKVVQLEESERKYRELSENLEAEVEKKRREIEKAHMQLVLRDKLASLGQLAAGVAHEINNPVGFIKSNLGTLSEYRRDLIDLLDRYRHMERIVSERTDMPKSEEVETALEVIRETEEKIDFSFIRKDFHAVIVDSMEGVERIAKIVADLKDFTHLDKAELEWADINKGIDSTLNVLSGEIRKKVDLSLSLDELPPIRCYPQQMNQAFMNILINAVQAIDAHGEIRITTRLKEKWIEICFGDNGCGIRPDDLLKVFDPFFTTKEVGEGTGLGLNVAYNIIKTHGGTISIRSKVGAGTKVFIRLPVKGK